MNEIPLRNIASRWDLKDDIPDFCYYYRSMWAYPGKIVDTINCEHK